MTQLILGL